MFLFNAVHAASAARSRGLPGTPFEHADLFSRIWRELAEAGASVPADTPIGSVRGRPFAALPNVFEPLAAIEAAGYAALEWTVATGPSTGAVVLVAPRD